MDLENCGRSNGLCNKHNGSRDAGEGDIKWGYEDEHTKKEVFNGVGDRRNYCDLLPVLVYENIIRRRIKGGMRYI